MTVEPAAIATAKQAIEAEPDPTLKSQLLASLCTALFRERGVELVVVGGSAIEFFTEGAYTSGDLDMCLLPSSAPLSLRLRQEIMGLLGGVGGPRSWRVAGLFVDILGPVEFFAKTPFRKLAAPYGEVALMKPEDLLVERVLVSVYPMPSPEARECARKLLAVALRKLMPVDWAEVWRVAARPEYDILAECQKLVKETADELGVRNPADPD